MHGMLLPSNTLLTYTYQMLCVLCVSAYVCLYICTYVCMCACMYVCMYVCRYVCMYVRTYVRMYVCMYVCMYVSSKSMVSLFESCVYRPTINTFVHTCVHAYNERSVARLVRSVSNLWFNRAFCLHGCSTVSQ